MFLKSIDKGDRGSLFYFIVCESNFVARQDRG